MAEISTGPASTSIEMSGNGGSRDATLEISGGPMFPGLEQAVGELLGEKQGAARKPQRSAEIEIGS